MAGITREDEIGTRVVEGQGFRYILMQIHKS
jgi:hypothetical protein